MEKPQKNIQVLENSFNTNVEIFTLGAGQDIGRSCIIIKIYDQQIMLDCGLHMSLVDNKKYPDLQLLKEKNGNKKMNSIIDLVIISHFHLDHCGALPYLTEKYGYSNPIIMSTPTRALLPYMLEDFRKVVNDNQQNQREKDKMEQEQQEGESSKEQVYIYSQDDIKKCVNKVSTIQLMESIEIKNVKIKSYYAGHVLGACMFLIEYNGVKVLYTGDFNSNADRHLGAATIDKIQPDIIITETTYATVVRDSKRARERDFLKKVQETIDNGGKVLIPVFALGRAQELCVLLESYWARVKNTTPIYFAGGLIEKANFYYKLFVNWENEKIQESYKNENVFNFKHILPFEKGMTKSPQAMVVLATPGMLHGGQSMQLFKEWCGNEKNVLIIPGYCVPGTLGNKLLSGQKNIVLYGQDIEVKMKVENMSFSAHADAKGILNLIRHCEAKSVVLVHGEKQKMLIFSKVVKEQLGIQVYMPANFETISIPIQMTNERINLQIDFKRFQNNNNNQQQQQQLVTQNEIQQQNQQQENQGFQTVEGLLIRTSYENYTFIDSELELKNLLQMLNQEQVGIKDLFYDHKIVDGYLILVNQQLLKKFEDKNDLLNHFKQILENVFKNHEKTQNNIEEYINCFQNLKIHDDYLLLEFPHTNDAKLIQKYIIITKTIQKYNNNL